MMCETSNYIGIIFTGGEILCSLSAGNGEMERWKKSESFLF